MTELDKKLSFLLDDHRNDDDQIALDEVIADVNLQYSMRRYQMIGEVMRHELPDRLNSEFCSQVMAKIGAQEGQAAVKSSVVSPPTSSLWDWISLKPLAGLALAATVAVVTITLWQPDQAKETAADAVASADQQKVDLLAAKPIQGNAVPVSLGTRWKVGKDAPALQQKLNAYLVNHTEYSNSMQGLIPQARVAGFDAQQ